MSPLRIALVGDGKMGRAINDLARERGIVVTAMLGASDNDGGKSISRDTLGDADTVIEFTEPHAAPANILAAVRAGYAVVTMLMSRSACGLERWLRGVITYVSVPAISGLANALK